MACCATGPCDLSTKRGGKGCYLCDVVALLPQPAARHVAVDQLVVEDAKKKKEDGPRRGRAAPAPAVRRTKRSAGGGLYD